MASNTPSPRSTMSGTVYIQIVASSTPPTMVSEARPISVTSTIAAPRKLQNRSRQENTSSTRA